jgi:hypothetical protein
VCESGRGSVSDTPFEVKLGADTISGAGDAPPYLYSFTPAFSATPAVAVVSQSAMDGTNGGWAQLHGATPLTASTLALSVDEDQLSDSERSHTNEQVAYAVFQANVVYPDGCPADPAKTSPGACGCGVPEVPNCSDECPSDPAKTAPGACGCGVPDTDSDGDGTPNCIDGCPADAAKLAPGVCGCGSSDADSDGDGTPNCNDGCPTDAAKLAPGVCGCGSSDADGDGDGTPNCNDGCPSDPAKLTAGACGCGVADTDGDGDGTANCVDGCPADAAKIAPGACGCGVADTDGDGDGTANCVDGCPADAAKIAPGACGCGVADTDGDGDGTANCNDGCPTDAAKLAPGVCGCGSSDADSDGDGTPNCNDACPTNPAKLSPGICGCGALDVDSDSDGTLDCQDGCPSDPAKTSPGVCGCGAADVDGDADGAADCQDGCPADPAKLEAGACGCGVAETDSDSDGIPDCIDTCSGSCGYPLEFITAAVSGTASTLLLSQSYVDPVVVCSAEYRANTRPVVVRVNNVLSNRFDVRLQNPSNQAVSSETVSCLVVEAGAWTVGGVKLEAQKYLSTVTDRATSWVGQRRTYLQSYTSPVVLGQVMSMNDASWSVFWSQGNTRTNPPSPTRLSTGKMVGEDTDITRADEVVGFVVIEAGHGTLAGVEYEAALGPDTVLGTGDTPPYTYTFRSRFAAQPRGAVVTMSAMDGTNGGWAQLFGSAPLSTTELRLAIDEDQISDSERSHANEQVAYVAFGSR